MSLPDHIGNGWFGGFLPTTAFAMVAATGNIRYGLWYPVVVALVTVTVGVLFIRDRKDVDLEPLGQRRALGETQPRHQHSGIGV